MGLADAAWTMGHVRLRRREGGITNELDHLASQRMALDESTSKARASSSWV